MDLSIIIPSYKRADLLKYGLQSLANQKVASEFEVIVLNDGVVDGTQKVCQSYEGRLNIRYVFTGQRNSVEPVWRIPGFAINVGARLAKGTFMTIMCPEMFLLDDCLQNVINELNRNPNQMVITDGKDDQDGKFLNDVIQQQSSDQLRFTYSGMPELNTKFPFFFTIPTKIFIDIGGYDEDFIGNCWDDQDIVIRLQQKGLRYAKLPYKVVHLYHSRLRYETDKIKEMWNYNKAVYDKKYGTIVRNENRDWGKNLNLKEPTNYSTNTEIKPTTDLEKHFLGIYENFVWKGKESKSGPGSDMERTTLMRPQLVEMINWLKVDSLLDLPCGDFNWMKAIIGQLKIKKYIGGDIVRPLLEENLTKYAALPITTSIDFQHINAVEEIPPYADVILCRDGLVHLSFDSIYKVLRNFRDSGAKYVILTHFTDRERQYPDIVDGAWHPLNFQLPPFSFPPPINQLREGCTECNGAYDDKSLAVWAFEDIKHLLKQQTQMVGKSIPVVVNPIPAQTPKEKPLIKLHSKTLKWTRGAIITSNFKINKKAKIKVAHIHPWWDSAGVGIIHAQKMNDYTDIGVRHIVAGTTCLKHDVDLILETNDQEIRKVLGEADILHFNTFWHDDPQLPIKFPWREYMGGKKLIFHMHGGSICFDYKKLEEISKVATMVTCSPLIPKFMPFTEWVPNILPIDEPQCLPKGRETIDPVKFLFMVNHDHNKGRAEMEWLFQKLNDVYGYKIPFESWLAKYSYMQGLEEKKAFDVIIDNITQGFIGMVGWEAMSQQQICMARLSPEVLENYTKLGEGNAPPIINVSGIDELAKWVLDLSQDVKRVKEIQKQGRRWMEKYYNPKRLCKLWEKRYKEMMK